MFSARLQRVLLVLLLGASVSACVPVLMGGAVVGTTMVATDRRSAGMQLEDQTIELRIRSAVSSRYGRISTADDDDSAVGFNDPDFDRSAEAEPPQDSGVRVVPSSYNGTVLLLGSAPDDATRNQLAQLAVSVDNVKDVVNRIEVGPPRTVAEAANDSLISGQVRAAFIGTSGLASNALVITTWRNSVYLQGLVTEQEAQTATRVASRLRGVNRVLTLFEPITAEEARRYANQDSALESTQIEGTGGQISQSETGSNVPAGVSMRTDDEAAAEVQTLAIPVPAAP